VPRDTAPTAATANSTTSSRRAAQSAQQQQILAALDCEITPVAVTSKYLTGILAVAAAMLLLPVAYLLLIALVGHTTYWMTVHNAMVLQSQPSRATVVFFALPLLLGVTLIVVLVKPLFARRAKESPPQRLSRDAEPFLYEYVERVAESVGAPAPRSIRVDCDVNASAGFRRGIASMFGHDLVLTIGMPLVAGLTVREFTGVLAHEFGHFAQHSGMRLSYVVRTINFWLMRVTFERDNWDESVGRFVGHLGGFGAIVGWLLNAVVWITRTILYGLCWLGNAISCYMLRQMEYDADLHAVRLIGRQTQKRLFRSLSDCGIAHSMALDDLQNFWTEGRLPDDFAALVACNLPRITPDMKVKLQKLMREQQTGMFDTHPSDSDRLANVWQEDARGVCGLPRELGDLPASVLFQNFRRLSRASSQEYYRAVLGDDFDPKKVHSSTKLIETREQEIAAQKALDRYFQTRIPLLRPLPIAEDAGQRPADPQALVEQIKTARANMLARVKEYETLCERHDEAESTVFRTTAALAFLDCKLPFKPADFKLPDARQKSVNEKLKRAKDGLHHLAARMLEYEAEAGNRLSFALQLLQLERVVKRIPDGDALRTEIRLLLPDAQFVSRQMTDLLSLRILHHRLGVLFSATKPNENRAPLINAIVETMDQLHTALTGLHEELGDRHYPFDHADATMTLQRYALPEVPPANNPWALNYVTEEAAFRLMSLQIRLFARLAHAAEKVETVLGLAPLPEPKPKDDDVPEADAA
jgi:Zn-dependent protease with chaperone function